MNKQTRFPEEFKIEAVKQVTERGHRVTEVAARLDVSQHSLYAWSNASPKSATS
jgi:transposase